MKIWIKYLLGIIVGIIFALASPVNNDFFNSALELITGLALRFGRYSLYPVLFFGFTISIFKFKDSKHLFRFGLFIFLFIIASAVFMSFFGLISVLIFKPAHIPIFKSAVEVPPLGIRDSLIKLFPSSAFECFFDGVYILPLCIFAGFAGAGCAVDKNTSKPIVTLLDSLSRVSYAVAAFFVDMFSIGLIALSISWVIMFREMYARKSFNGLIILLIVDLLIITFIVCPILIKIACKNVNPYKILYAALAPVTAAFISGDTNSTIPILLRHANESLGVRRRITSSAIPLFSIFGRAGSAMTVTISFLIILKSYSPLGINIKDMFWLAGMSVVFSFLLGKFPVGGAYIALASICTIYGSGFDSAFLILQPAAFFIGSIAAAADTVITITCTFIIGHTAQMANIRDIKFFI